MLNPIHNYWSKIGTSILLSETYTTKNTLHLRDLTKCTVISSSNDEYRDFLNFYFLTNLKLVRKFIYLSRSQKKYQTVTFQNALLSTSTNPIFIWNKFLTHFSTNLVFQHYLKNSISSPLTIKKQCIAFKVTGIPFIFTNQNELFEVLFNSYVSNLSIELGVQFNTKSLAKQFWYLNHLKFLRQL